MFGLVRFPDQTYGIYSMKNIMKIEGDHACIVKHKGAKYEAAFITKKDQKDELRIIQNEMLEEREAEEKSACNYYFNDSKIGNEFVNMERSSTSSINHDHVFSDVNGDKQYSDGAFQEQKGEIRIFENKMSEERKAAEESICDYHFTDSKIGKEYVNMERLSFSPINHDYVSSAVSGDKENSDGAFQDTGRKVIIIEDILINPRKSPEKSLVNEDFNDFSIGIDYVEMNRSSNSFINNFDENNFSAVCGEKEDGHESYISQDFEDDSDDDPDFYLSPNSETHSDDSRVSDQNYVSSGIDFNIEKKEQVRENDDSPSRTIQVHLSASLTEAGCDDEKMKVTESRGRNGDKKPNFCFFCHTKQLKIARHLENKHSGEDEVKKFMMLPKGNIERAKIIGQIRKRGNFIFNTNENFNDGELIVSRRPKNITNKTAKDYSACANCRGFFSKNTLRVHFKSCAQTYSSSKRLANLLSKKITGRLHPKASLTVRNHLFPPLRDDDVCRVIRYDELIIIYANKMVEKYRDARHFQMIRQRLRLLGNFLINIRALDKEIKDLSSIYDPKFVDTSLSAINTCARYTETTNCYEAPSVAFSLGTLLKQIGEILIIECIKNHKDEMKKNVKDFLKVFSQEVNINVNKTVAETQLKISRSKTVMLPTMGDIKKLCEYLTKKRKDALEKLRYCFTPSDWMALAEATLTSIQVFNRRRAGEVERISINDFEKRETVENSNNDLFQSLPDKSKEVARKYVRFTIRGKLNRTVPVLLDLHLCECIQLILEKRINMRVHKNNPYIFGTPGSDSKNHPHLSACNLMRKFSEACGADHPTRLRGTNLRKHIATTCITLNLENQDVVDLSNFMGHSENIHKGIYRQPIISRDILGISKLLETAQGVNDHGSSDESENDGVDESNELIPANEVHSAKGTPKNTGDRKKSIKDSTFSTILRKVRWTQEEKDSIFRIFGDYIDRKALPPLKVIQRAIKETPVLQNRTSPQIKTWIHNQLRNSKKKLTFSDGNL